MLREETDPNKIKVLLAKINENPELLTRLSASFIPGVDLREFVIEDIMSPQFPLAVDPLLISDDTPEEKSMRAETILNVWLPELQGKRFLDFGCGEGFIPVLASRTAEIAVGCDIDTTGWDMVLPKDNLFLLEIRPPMYLFEKLKELLLIFF
jgi:SAM-dependent methyltransferase